MCLTLPNYAFEVSVVYVRTSKKHSSILASQSMYIFIHKKQGNKNILINKLILSLRVSRKYKTHFYF